ncbi:MAG: hypothetical protein HC880_15325, partial [Bacteroidia bacterium]|nr:hypothetical protein [Bacteroidia bacterium]
LTLENKYGSLEIASLGAINGSSSFSSLGIGALKESLKMSTKSDSRFEVRQIASSFNLVSIDCQYSSIDLDFSDDANFLFNVYTSFGNLKLDETKAKMHKASQTHTSAAYEGQYGSGTPGNRQVNIVSKYGNIHFK